MAARSINPAEVILVAMLAAWLAWLLIVTERTGGQLLADGLPYASFPTVLLLGLLLGRLAAGAGTGVPVPAVVSVLALALLVIDPFYTNAQAAFGVQVVALAGLALHTQRFRPGDEAGHFGPRRDATRQLPSRAAPAAAVLAVAAGVIGVLLAARSQAATALVVPLAVLVMASVVGRATVPRAAIVGIGLGSVGTAVLAVLALGSSSQWPTGLRDPGSLSRARHELWGDALELWTRHPVTGAGPGSFFEFSQIARSEPHLYAVHSSILQVGAELGVVGAALFLGVLVAGAAVAVGGDSSRGLVGVAAWCALAVHSMIDHLYEFPLVVLLAGVVIGWSGAREPGGATALALPR